MKYIFRDLKSHLLQKVQIGMAEQGFKFDQKSGYFDKTMPGVRWSFGLGFIKHTSDFDVTANVSVGLDSLEQLLQKGDDSYSLGAELGNIADGKQKRWNVITMEDVDQAATDIMDAFADIGLPYLEKYSVMENALEAFRGDDKAAWLHSPVDVARAKRAIGLAFLLNKREEFQKLAEQKTAFLKNRNDPKIEDFLHLRQELEVKLSAK